MRHDCKRKSAGPSRRDCRTSRIERDVLQERLNDELRRGSWRRLGPTQPRAKRWDDPSGGVGTEPGPTVSSSVGCASHSLPN